MNELLASAVSDAAIPAASVAVWSGDSTDAAATGLLNVRTGVEATPESVFQVGSITKVLTATLILQLRDQRLLDLDDTVSRHLPAVSGTSLGAIRIRSLLAHLGGLAADDWTDTGEGEDCIARYVELLSRKPVLFAPDVCPSYSNPGFAVLGAVSERVAGRRWDDLLLHNILRPAGMDHSFTRPIELAKYRAAIGHYTDPATGSHSPVPVVALPASTGPGGATLWSTATDLVRFARALATGSPPLLAPDSVAEMLTPRARFPAGDGAFGYAWALTRDGDLTFASHGGATIGQNSLLMLVPERRFAVALLTNTGNGVSRLTGFTRQLVADHVGHPPPGPVGAVSQPPPVPEPGRYVGEYLAGEVRFHIRATDDGLAIGYENLLRPDIPERSGQGVLVPTARDEFLSGPANGGGPGLPVRFLTLAAGSLRPDVLYVMGRAYRRLDTDTTGADTGTPD